MPQLFQTAASDRDTLRGLTQFDLDAIARCCVTDWQDATSKIGYA
jgi:hypothetical protein